MKLLTIGTFDVLHYGHINLLKTCEALADEVVVGVNTDTFVEAYKGSMPIMSLAERTWALQQLGYETMFNASAGRELIDEVKPNTLAIGTDWATRDYLAQIDVTWDYLEKRQISLIYIPYTREMSTTIIKERCKQSS